MGFNEHILNLHKRPEEVLDSELTQVTPASCLRLKQIPPIALKSLASLDAAGETQGLLHYS